MHLTIRAFEDADEPAVIQLWHACGLVRPQNDPRRDITRKIAHSPELFLVGESDGPLIGSVMAGYEGHRGWINYLAVHPAFRTRGFGKAMMARAEALLRQRGCPKINLQVRHGNDAAIAFYRQLGYQEDAATSLGKRLVHDAAPVAVATEDRARSTSPSPYAPRRMIAVFPPVPEGHAIHRLRRRFDPRAGLIAPHLTLVFPFASMLDTANLVAHLQRVAEGMPPFDVRLEGVTGHESEYLFLNVRRGNDALVDLHHRLYGGPLAQHRSPRHTFVPHLTVGRLRDPADFERAVAEVAQEDVRLDLRVERLTLCISDDDRSCTPEAEVDLGGEPQ